MRRRNRWKVLNYIVSRIILFTAQVMGTIRKLLKTIGILCRLVHTTYVYSVATCGLQALLKVLVYMVPF